MPGIDRPASMAPEFQRQILSDDHFDLDPKIQKALVDAFDTYAEMAQAEADAAEAKMIRLAQIQAGATAGNTSGGE